MVFLMTQHQKNKELLEELQRSIDIWENQGVEFIEDYPEQAHDLAKEIAAFATTNTGMIYLGVDNNRKIKGIKKYIKTLYKLKDSISNRLSGICQNSVKPAIILKNIDFIEVEDKIVVKIFVPKGKEPIYYSNNIPYIRNLTSSIPATPDQVKEIFRQYYISQEPQEIVDKKQKTFFNLLMQLSDFELLWSDHEIRNVNPDLEQLRYDIGSTGRSLIEISFDNEIKQEGFASELTKLGSLMEDLENHQFYIDGGKSWKEFEDKGNRVLETVEKIISRVKKRVSLSNEFIIEISKSLEKNIQELNFHWTRRDEYLKNGKILLLKDHLRRLAYNIYRISNIPIQYEEFEYLFESKKMALELRELSSIKYFRMTIGHNPLSEIDKKMNEIIEKLNELSRRKD